MSKSRSLVVALMCSLVVMPTISRAQKSQKPDSTKERPDDFVHDVLKGLLSPNWNLFAHGGVTMGDRFLLQQVTSPTAGQRSLQTGTGWNIGAGGGVDVFLRMGFRASYTYRSSNLNFRTDNGDGSDALNVDDVGTLKTNTLALEVMRYMLPSGAAITPYGTLGIQGTWWALDEKSPLVTSQGASTQFSMSPLFSFGMQFKANKHFSARLEATLSSGHNPFTGNKSYRALTGTTIDEPTDIRRTDFRVAGVYHFGRPGLKTTATPMADK